MENVACTAGAVEAAQVVVAVVVASGCLTWGHLALINVWGRGGPGRWSTGRERRQRRAWAQTQADLRGASLCPKVPSQVLEA